MDGPKSTTRLTDRQNRTPTGKSSPWISANFSFHLFSFHQEFPTAHINSYNIHNIDNFHANELVATVIGISQRLCCCLQNTQEFMAYFTCFGRAFVILWTSEWVVSVWKRSTILIFWINIKLTLIDSMNLFNARLFCNSVHLMNL